MLLQWVKRNSTRMQYKHLMHVQEELIEQCLGSEQETMTQSKEGQENFKENGRSSKPACMRIQIILASASIYSISAGKPKTFYRINARKPR